MRQQPAADPPDERACCRERRRGPCRGKGRIDFPVFPNNPLGTVTDTDTDTDTLSQVHSGALDFFTLSPLILGAHGRKQIAAGSSLVAFEKIRDNG